MGRSPARDPSGQALVEALIGSGVLVILISGILIFSLALTGRAILAHALEENLVCRRSMIPKPECARRLRSLIANIPGEVKAVSVRNRDGEVRGVFRWKFLGYVKEIRVEENSPLSE